MVSHTDIDECSNNDLCEHECQNTIGSYQCQCDHGFQLGSDGHHCDGK